MTRLKNIAIATRCRLAAYGLRQLLAEYFGRTQCRVFASAEELAATGESFDLYFVEPDALLFADYFMPRRARVVVLTNSTSGSDASSVGASTGSSIGASESGGFVGASSVGGSSTAGVSTSFRVLPRGADVSTIIDSLQTIFEQLEAPQRQSAPQEELSAREVEVLRLITRGKINKEIADELCISLNTVLTHRKNITSKLGIKTVSGLTFYAMMNGIVS
jgi:DNA-binding NarL/FixJ family response regulator